MSKVEDYWKSILQAAKENGINKSIDDIERAWRFTRNELGKEGISPDDPKFNSELMTRTKAKVMKESKFQKYILEKESFEDYKKHSPNTKHTEETFNAGQYKKEELRGDIKVGNIVNVIWNDQMHKPGEKHKIKITAIHGDWIYGRTIHE